MGDRHVGGFDELCTLDKNGELDKMLTENLFGGLLLKTGN